MKEPAADDQLPDADPSAPHGDPATPPDEPRRADPGDGPDAPAAGVAAGPSDAAGPPDAAGPSDAAGPPDATAGAPATDPGEPVAAPEAVAAEPAAPPAVAAPEADGTVDSPPSAATESPATEAADPAAADPEAAVAAAVGRVRGSALFAAVLSTLIPGLGQLWAGSRRRGAILAVPFIALVACLTVVGLALATRVVDAASVLAFFLQPSTLAGLLVLDGLFLVYRLVAIVDAWLLARRRWPVSRDRVTTATSIALLLVLVGVNVGAHAGVGYLENAVAEIDASFLGGDSGPDALLPPDESLPPDDTPTPGAIGGGDGRLPEPPSAVPIVTPVPGPAWMSDGRLNVLLLGVDAGPGRWGVRTDTMILASVDVATGQAAMFGIPRNLLNVPLPTESRNAFDCGCFPMLLNALYTYAFGHPSQFPGGDNRGYRAVAGAIETLTGVHLDGVAIIDLNGFVKLIDALGGLRITIPQPLYDDHYPKPDGTGDISIYIPAGRHKLNGITALEYARSRHESSDYSRMRRQQAVLIALRAQIQPCNVIGDLPRLLDAVKGTVQTTFTPADLPDLLRLAARVSPDRIQEFAFDPPDYPEFLGKSDIARIRTLVRHVFDPPQSGSKASPTPSPTPNPFPTPTEDPCSSN